MLAYVIIVAELAILYAVYWYIFLYEPAPAKVKGDPWGRYAERCGTVGGISLPEPAPPFAKYYPGEIDSPFMNGQARARYRTIKQEQHLVNWQVLTGQAPGTFMG